MWKKLSMVIRAVMVEYVGTSFTVSICLQWLSCCKFLHFSNSMIFFFSSNCKSLLTVNFLMHGSHTFVTFGFWIISDKHVWGTFVNQACFSSVLEYEHRWYFEYLEMTHIRLVTCSSFLKSKILFDLELDVG